MEDILTGEHNKVLRAKSKAVEADAPETGALVRRMRDILQKTEHGIGLAAPQAGENARLFVIYPERIWQEGDVWKPEDMPRVFLNPGLKIIGQGKTKETEGCLSLPEAWLEIERAKKVEITAKNPEGKKIKLKASGLLARVFQHETDHLDGVLIVDYATDK